MAFKNDIPDGFSHPTALPGSSDQERKWQEANRSCWENHPMRYDWKARIPYREFSKEFYQEIDSRFFKNANEYMPWKKIPFDFLIDFSSLSDKDVLEIGVGNGSHAQLLAQHACSFTGIDITEYAVKSTSERMRCFKVKATIIRMDAEHLEFNDNSFDFIWSWGVVHHSSNPQKILEEMRRVLRSGGKAITMVYHRNYWNYYIMGGLFRGILQGDLLRTKSLHKTVQRYTDGAIARFYTISEWESLVSDIFLVERIAIFGSKAEIIPLPAGRVKKFIMEVIPNNLSRFFTNKMEMGSFLVSVLKKKVKK